MVDRPNQIECRPAGHLPSLFGGCLPELEMIEYFQSFDYDLVLAETSEFLTPKNVIVGLTALSYYLANGKHTLVHLAVVAAWIVSDSIHFIAKWGFAGDRPYWVDIAQGEGIFPLRIKQHSHSCEGGYGFPSGHVTIFCACVFAFLSQAFLRLQTSFRTKVVAYALGFLLSALVMFSRSYTAAHFPSQTVYGLGLG
jgi:membrane-associated phospholipid phosphatase